MISMPWKSIVLVIVAILGVILLLYGANYYDALVGYLGLLVIIIAIVGAAVIKLFERTRKRESLSEPVQL